MTTERVPAGLSAGEGRLAPGGRDMPGADGSIWKGILGTEHAVVIRTYIEGWPRSPRRNDRFSRAFEEFAASDSGRVAEAAESRSQAVVRVHRRAWERTAPGG